MVAVEESVRVSRENASDSRLFFNVGDGSDEKDASKHASHMIGTRRWLAMKRIAFTVAFTCMVAVLAAAIGLKAEAQKKRVLVVKGDAAVAHLMDDLAQSFMRDHPDYSIVVSGGAAAGSAQAILSGEAQVWMSAQKLSPEEEKLAESKGAKLGFRLVDWEGVAVICHPSNPVTKLTLGEVRNLFTGRITNWSQVKGPQAPVDAVVIETPRSGIGSYFNQTALGNRPIAPSARVFRYFRNLIADVAKDPNAVGYAPIRLVEQARGKNDVKILAIARSELHEYIPASAQTVKDRSYLLITPFFLFYDENAKSEGPRIFVDYCTKKRLLGK
jgi:phosphate transport system substrate-binding protein